MPLDVIKWIKGWRLDKFFKSVKDNIDKVAISVTEAVKNAAEGEAVKAIASVIDEALHSTIAEDGLELIKTASVKALAVELAIQGVPDNPTGEDILKFEKAAFEAITGMQPEGKSKLWTTFAAQLYSIIKDALEQDNKLTFAEIVAIVEAAYKAYKSDLESN